MTKTGIRVLVPAKRGLRRAHRHDLDALARLERSRHPHDRMGKTGWAAVLEHPQEEVWVAPGPYGIDGVLALACRRGGTNLRITDLTVARSVEGNGLGARLLAHALRRARALDRCRLTLEVRTDNTRALAFYAARGFQRAGYRYRYYEDGANGIRMRRDVAP